jgi:hypothetical protein
VTTGPLSLTLWAELEAADLAAALSAVIAGARDADGMPIPVSWRPGGTEAAIETPPQAGTSRLAFDFDTSGRSGQLERMDAGLFRLRIDDRSDVARALPSMRSFLAATARAGLLRSGSVERVAGGHCLPWLPLVGDAAHVVACPDAAVDRCYSDRAAFFRAWDECDRGGSVPVLSRAMDALGNPDFLRAVLPGTLAMARAARPGQMRIYPPRFAAGEFELLNEGDPTLTSVGYHAAGQVFEFAGHIPDGAELRWIDVLTAWRVAKDGKLEDGRPVREVRAIFMDEEQARRARALLDPAGVRSWWEDSAGVIHQARATR